MRKIFRFTLYSIKYSMLYMLCIFNMLYRFLRRDFLHSEVCITLTSFGQRINARLALVLLSIKFQRMRPMQIRLYISRDEILSLPWYITMIAKIFKEIQIISVENFRSYKKIFPLLSSDYEGYFVTADDDIFYTWGWLNSLWQENERVDISIPAVRIHQITLDSAGVLPYSRWIHAANMDRACPRSIYNFPTSGAGILLNTKYFSDSTLDWSALSDELKTADDIFIYFELIKKNLRVSGIECGPKLCLELFDPALEGLNLSKINNGVFSNNDVAFSQCLASLGGSLEALD